MHIGSLLTAVASYLDARRHAGRWLVRMEDIDPPREQPGAADHILRTLERFALQSDEPVLFQSRRAAAHRDALDALRAAGRVFACTCSRRDLAATGGRYPGTCRGRTASPPQAPFAWRLRIDTGQEVIEFRDRVQGRVRRGLVELGGDFVIWRSDGLAAYHLAAVVDDAYQQVTDVVRGADLLGSTAQQIYLHAALGSVPPRHAHVPVLVGAGGRKLSKQTFARDVFPATRQAARVILYSVLELLGLAPPATLVRAEPHEQLAWACDRFAIARLPRSGTYSGYLGLGTRGSAH